MRRFQFGGPENPIKVTVSKNVTNMNERLLREVTSQAVAFTLVYFNMFVGT